MPKLPPLDLPRLLYVSHDTKTRRAKAVIVLLHGIGGSGRMWRHVAESAPDSVRVISLDLLGFGQSPKPKNASYNVRVQARSVAATLVALGIRQRIIVVGHSMGSLIAIELARRYRLALQGLVLCAPPIYTSVAERNDRLFGVEPWLLGIYETTSQRIGDNPERYIGLARAATTTRLMPSTFEINRQTVYPYQKALRASVIDQSAYRDIQTLKLPIHIIYGTLDPFVVSKNLKRLAKQHPNIQLKRIVALHEIRKPYYQPIDRALTKLLPKDIMADQASSA